MPYSSRITSREILKITFGVVLIFLPACGKLADFSGIYGGTQTLTIGGVAQSVTVEMELKTEKETLTGTWKKSLGHTGVLQGTVTRQGLEKVIASYDSATGSQGN